MSLYLITGGCGFIGSHLADALVAAGHEVRILDDLSTGRLANKPAPARFLHGNVSDPEVVAEAMRGVDGCFHLAAVASVERATEDWIASHRTNLTGSITVLDAARRAGPPVPVVYASSAAVYGDNPDVPLKENAAKRPLSSYGADKLGSEQHAFVAGRVHRVPTCGLRFFNVYGPRQDPNSPYSGVVSIFCDRLKAGDAITIFGDGHQTRDFIYVGDVVRALMAAMRHVSIDGPVYNVCTGRPTTLLDLAAAVAHVVKAKAKLSFRPTRIGDIRNSLGDPTAAAGTLGFAAEVDLRTGLLATIEGS